MSVASGRNLYTAAQVRAFDRLAIESFEVPGLTLMRRAGRFCYERLRERWPHARSIVVLCGGGNNGGDGFVIAQLACEAGLEVRVLAVSSLERLGPDAKAALDTMRAAGLEPMAFAGDRLPACDVVVDAMLGTGLDRELTGTYASAVQAANQADAAVLSVDIPTGLHADTGAELGCAVLADATCTFIGLKTGLFTARGPQAAGVVLFDDLAVPAAVFDGERAKALLVDSDTSLARLTPRARDAHKGHFGHVLVVGGNHGYGGALLLAVRACLRTGAGLVSATTHATYVGPFAASCPEAMFSAVTEGSELAPLLARADVVAIGPGLGQDDWARGMLDQVLAGRHSGVFDADALNLLADTGTHVLPADSVLTPHPGEAGRLLGCSTAEIQQDRLHAAAELARRFDAHVILKGAGTVIASADRMAPLRIAPVGNPGLAAGGSGDTLTGITAALIAQKQALGITTCEAVEMAVCAHGAAADRAALDGERGMVSSDVSASLRAVVNPAGTRA